jgi:hypothetical protein
MTVVKSQTTQQDMENLNHMAVDETDLVFAGLKLYLSLKVCEDVFDLLSFLELTPEERQLLVSIRLRKHELLQEIAQLRDELNEVNGEIDAMDTEEG